MKNICKKIVFLFVLSIILKTNIIVKADVSVTDGGLSSGSNSACGTYGGYVACYSPKFQFRVTLVDKNGKKVVGTRSIDISYSTDKKTHVYNAISDAKLINKNFEYKYSDKYNDYNDIDLKSNEDNFVYIKLYLADLKNQNGTYKYTKYTWGGQDDYSKYNLFYKEFSNKIINRTINENLNIEFTYNSAEKADLLSVFLYHMNYTKTESGEKPKKNIDQIQDKKKEIAQNDYYLLIEPTYTIYYNTTPWSSQYNYIYGTGNEILKWMKKEIENNNAKYMNGYLVGLSLNFVYQLSCNMYSTPEIKNEFGLITDETLCGTNTDFYKKTNINGMLASRSDRTLLMEMALNKNKGYGASVMRLKNAIPGPEEYSEPIYFNANLCNSGDGIISLDVVNSQPEKMKNEIFNVIGDGTAALYCYDEVDYNFKQIMETFNSQNFKTASNIEIPNVVANINRYCWYQSNQTSEMEALNYENYTKNSIKLNVFKDNELDNYINLEYKATNTTSVSDNRVKYGTKIGQGWVHYETKITYSYQNSDGTNKYYLSPNKNYKLDGTVGFSVDNLDQIFGKSNNIITQLMENPNHSITIDGTEYIMHINDGTFSTESPKCDFTYTVENQTPQPPGETPDVINSIVDFRIISLSNPFPARDGTSRLPGLNWLNTENYVYNYITNNRGIQYVGKANNSYAKITYDNGNKLINPEEMYNKIEPMYTITLDPSTMMEIRKYNKDRTYSDIELECNDQKRECTSKFLRNSAYIPEDNLSGTCSDSRNYHIVLEDYSSLTMENMRKYVYGNSNNYYSVYDLNKNGMIDTEDVEILEKHLMTEEELKALENKEKNTNFYTCADKSYKSGG